VLVLKDVYSNLTDILNIQKMVKKNDIIKMYRKSTNGRDSEELAQVSKKYDDFSETIMPKFDSKKDFMTLTK
jgi:hypothetical protein